MTERNPIAEALWGTHSRDDQTITDALFAIADAIDRVADKIEATGFPPLAGQTFDGIAAAIGEVADALDSKGAE